MLPKEQIPQIKKQIIEQVNTTFPEDKKASAIQQIESMADKEFEEFLIQNNMIKSDGTPPEANQCIFCSIISGKLQSYKIGDNNQATAILEINPISKGHAIIIPKKHITSPEKMPDEANILTKKISKKIKEEFKPKSITIASSNLFGHEIINVLPIYNNETLSSEKHPAKPEELQALQKQLTKSETDSKTEQKPREIISDKNYWLPKRIP